MSTSQGAVPEIWRYTGYVSCHRFCGISTYGLNGLGKGDEHLTCAPLRSTATFIFSWWLSIWASDD